VKLEAGLQRLSERFSEEINFLFLPGIVPGDSSGRPCRSPDGALLSLQCVARSDRSSGQLHVRVQSVGKCVAGERRFEKFGGKRNTQLMPNCCSLSLGNH